MHVKAPANSRLLIFDLDETLVHCFENNESGHAENLNAQTVEITTRDGDVLSAQVNVRPFARECLQQTGTRFHIGIFTASNKDYADAIIDQILDPLGCLVKFRMYREHCVQTMDGIYIKDLTVIKSHSLDQILLVDNSVHSFGLQLANGIPIVPFYDDGQDQELVHLASYVLSLANVENLVSVNSATFKLEELKAADLTSYLQ